MSKNTWRRYLRFWRTNVDADIDDELRFHFDERIESLTSHGLDAAAARTQAEREFGDLAAVRDGLRAIGQRREMSRQHAEHWERFRQDLTYSMRSLARARGLSLTIVVTLALGIGANATLFSLLDRVFLRMPGGIAQPEHVRRLYWLGRGPNNSRLALPHFSIPLFRAVRDAADTVADLTIFRQDKLRLGDAGQNASTVLVQYAGPDYFRVLGVRPAVGRFFSADEEAIEVGKPVAVISHAFWRNRLGGASDVLGRNLTINRMRLTIVGVAPADFSGPDLDAIEVWLPLGAFNGFGAANDGRPPWYQQTTLYAFQIVGRPAASATPSSLEARATVGLRQAFLQQKRRDSTSSVLTGSLIAARGPESPAQEMRISTRLGGVALIVLFIACANVANLLLSRGLQRRREIAVRTALGIDRSGVIRLLLLESVLLAFAAGIAALAVTATGGGLLRALLFPDIQWKGGPLDWRVGAFTVLIALAAGVVAGLLPAIQSSRPDLVSALKGGAREGVRRSRLRSVLVVSQSALSVVLLVGAALFIRSLRNVRALDLGFDMERLMFVSVRTDDEAQAVSAATRTSNLSLLAKRLTQVPGVERVALASMAPMYGFSFNGVFYQTGDTLPRAADGLPGATGISPEFFAAAGLRILRGRGFESSDPKGPNGVLVVNEALARSAWPNGDAVGKCLRLSKPTSPCATIVGVVEDSRRSQLIEETVRQVYVPVADTGFYSAGTVIVRVPPGRSLAAEVAARREVAAIVPGAEADVKRMAAVLDPQYRPWRLGATLFSAFGLLALLVAAVGVYSTVSTAVGQRRQEFGVRVALGARAEDVVALVVGGGVRIVALGIALGALLALAAGRLIASLLYGTTPHDPVALITVSTILLLVAAVASMVPAWRASRVDPVEALRAE
jgi:predicted permease